MNRENNIAVLGAFVMEGITNMMQELDIIYSDLWVSDDLGWYEFVYEATASAGYMQDCYDLGLKATDGNAPGVFPYEVTNDYGRWFVKQTRLNGNYLPSPVQCQMWIKDATREFFNQGRLPL